MGYYNLELKDAITAKFFDKPDILNLIQSLSELCCKLLAERHDYYDLYYNSEHFLQNIDGNNCLKLYIEWEQELLKSIGFEINPDNKNFNFYKIIYQNGFLK